MVNPSALRLPQNSFGCWPSQSAPVSSLASGEGRRWHLLAGSASLGRHSWIHSKAKLTSPPVGSQPDVVVCLPRRRERWHNRPKPSHPTPPTPDPGGRGHSIRLPTKPAAWASENHRKNQALKTIWNGWGSPAGEIRKNKTPVILISSCWESSYSLSRWEETQCKMEICFLCKVSCCCSNVYGMTMSFRGTLLLGCISSSAVHGKGREN